MTIVINDAADVKDFLWRWLGLDRRSIIFHSIEAGIIYIYGRSSCTEIFRFVKVYNLNWGSP